MFRAIKIRLYPNKTQEQTLNRVLGCYRFVYNQMLAQKQNAYDADKKANVLRRIATTYHNLVFVDDDDKNLHGVLGLNMPNIVVVKTFSK